MSWHKVQVESLSPILCESSGAGLARRRSGKTRRASTLEKEKNTFAFALIQCENRIHCSKPFVIEVLLARDRIINLAIAPTVRPMVRHLPASTTP